MRHEVGSAHYRETERRAVPMQIHRFHLDHFAVIFKHYFCSHVIPSNEEWMFSSALHISELQNIANDVFKTILEPRAILHFISFEEKLKTNKLENNLSIPRRVAECVDGRGCGRGSAAEGGRGRKKGSGGSGQGGGQRGEVRGTVAMEHEVHL